jgi:FxsC-like protein
VPYFFLSYARGTDDVWVEKFYRDLCDELRRRSDVPAEESVGFIDTGIGVGIRWSAELEHALASCQVLLALYSPRYFLRENCGREWAYFRERLRRYEEQTGLRANSIIPVIWVPPRDARDLPPVAREINYRDEDLGARYAAKGLYGIIRVNRFQDDYHEFLGELARKIIDVAHRHPMPRLEQLTINGVASAFPEGWTAAGLPPRPADEHAAAAADDWPRAGTPRAAAPPGTAALAEPAAGPAAPAAEPPWPTAGSSRHVQFMVAATGVVGLPAERTQREYYGDYAADWRPYLPDCDERLSLLAQRGALNHGFTTSLATIRDDLLARLEQARELNQVTILLVDVWATGLDPHRRLLRQYDDRNEPTTGVMVPWNEADGETAAAGAALTARLHEVFPNNLVRRDKVFRTRLENASAFEAALSEVLTEAQNRVFSLGVVRRRAMGDRWLERPILDAP